MDIENVVTPVRTATIKKSTNNKCWIDVEEGERSHSVDGNADCYSHCGEQCGIPLKTGTRTAM